MGYLENNKKIIPNNSLKYLVLKHHNSDSDHSDPLICFCTASLAALTNKKLQRLIVFNFVDRFFWTATSDGPLACVASAGSKDGRDAWQEQGNIGIFLISLDVYA